MITTDIDSPVVSFPKIQHKRITTSKEPIQKNMASLPALQNKHQIKEQMRQLQMLKKAEHKDEDEIVNEIEQKMKQVI